MELLILVLVEMVALLHLVHIFQVAAAMEQIVMVVIPVDLAA